jgi:hypothetical protein
MRGKEMEIGEQRKHERLEIARQAPGKFRLLTPAGAYPIAAIRDLSGSGIRVFLDVELEERLDVVIEYTEATLKLEIQGRVAWSVEQEEVEATKSAGRYVVGIELFSPFLFMSMAGLY